MRVARLPTSSFELLSDELITRRCSGVAGYITDEKSVLGFTPNADSRAGKHSVCSDIGAAILGYQEGDAIDWRISDRTRCIEIRKVLYQPEAAGDFHL